MTGIRPVRRPIAVSILAVVCLMIGACTSSESTSNEVTPAEDDLVTETARPRTELRPTIVLGVTNWTGARLNVAIAEQVVEFRLGYPVELTEITDTSTMVADLASGELDAVLEVWPGVLAADDEQALDTGAVDVLGELGVVGKVGWFVPRYVVEADPALGQWEAYRDPATAARFATAETGDRGRLLGTDPAWEQVDEEIIEALALPFDVTFSGSEDATVEELGRATSAGEPVLVYWWTPTAEVARFDLVNVALPERTVDCEASIEAGRPQACDYPEEMLLKLGAPGLEGRAPEVYRFLRAFRLSTEDQLALIDAVENEGLSISEATSRWITDNGERWEQWFQ